MDDVVMVGPVDVDAELDRLAARYRKAGGIGVQMLSAVGGRAEGLLDKLPTGIRDRLGDATSYALTLAMRGAQKSRGAVKDQQPWVNTAVATAMGAAGGFGGLPSALVELPATTAVLMRAIQGVAAQHGFNPDEESVQFDCIRVFAAAGPLSNDDGGDLAFFTLRLTLTGGAMQKLIATVAPKLAVALGHKLAAQAVPVLGALAGASANYVYTRYYQEIAHVHFGMRRLAIDADIPHEQLVTKLQQKMKAPSVKRA
ncbi:EcsC family protein [Seohaeicola nanhaiensis]|uniref:EcsC family protein n=1 Tax=Seohaeicola nanhaiensis TaxID=1387282 RepID=A0ABV9KAN4_9RHOB